jgi:hypothetical protein
MKFIAETSSNGVIERTFTVDDVPGVLWSPASGPTGGPLILMGHPGGLHKKAPGLVDRVHHYVTTCGFTAASIDSPGHGDRPRSAPDEAWVAAMFKARAAGEPIGPIVTEYNGSLAERAVPEWQATIDALQSLPEIGPDAPIGYSGMTLATAIGIPLAAVDDRIAAAVFGGVLVYDALTDAARKVTIPLQFILPLDDPELPREPGLAVFDAFGSSDKILHAHPGNHFKVPWSETESSVHFFQRHLT